MAPGLGTKMVIGGIIYSLMKPLQYCCIAAILYVSEKVGAWSAGFALAAALITCHELAEYYVPSAVLQTLQFETYFDMISFFVFGLCVIAYVILQRNPEAA